MRSVSAFLSNRILQRGFVTQTTSASASAAAATTTTARTSLYQSTSPHPKILSLQLQQQQQQQQPRLCNKSFTNSRRLLSTSKSNNNRPKIKPDTHLKPSSSSVYGLRRIDYSLVVPPRWPMPPHPPPQKGLRRFVFPVTLIMSLSLAIYIYFNQEDDIQDYWRQVDAGHVPLDGMDDDDDDDDDDEDDE